MVEPDPHNLGIGRKNFALNDSVGKFVHARVGSASSPSQPFLCESDGVTREIPCICVDDLVGQESIERVEILLVDTQGAELAALQGAMKTIQAGKLRFVLLSTHHHSISRDPILHHRCLDFLKTCGAHIITEHSVAESYSGDGLIAASFFEQDKIIAPITVSRNRASTALFRECEFDLAEAYEEIARLRTRPSRASD
jgi:FkbM family methyltransferase